MASFPICGLWSEEGGRNSFFGEAIYNKRGKFKLLGFQIDLSAQVSSLSGTSWSPHKKNTDESIQSAYCNDYGKSSESIFFQSMIYSM